MADKPRIFGWLADHAGCGWYRVMLPLGALQEAGRADTLFSGRIPEDAPERFDVIIGQRVFKPGPTYRWQEYARRSSRPMMVYEVDDDLLNVGPDNPASKTFGAPEVQENIRRNIEVADLVTVSTEPLADRMALYNRNVHVLPNCVPTDLLAWRRGTYSDRFTVGWQGSNTHEYDWTAAARPVASWFRRAGASAEMHSIGALPATFPHVPNHRHTPWSPDIARYYITVDWHVALAPLQNTAFNRSKSDIRVLEAAMLGIPSIASDVPAYRTIEHGKTGWLVSRAGQWREFLDWAYQGGAEYDRMVQSARAWAESRTIEQNAEKWLVAYGAH